MVNRTRRTERLVVLVLALVASALAYVVPAQAATPNATTLHVHESTSGPDLVLTANVWSKAGVPSGTVTFFRIGEGAGQLGAPVPVDATGAASITLPDTPGWPPNYSAQFTGSPGWADSTGNVLIFGESVKMSPVGTILHIGGPGLIKLLTQTFSAKVVYASDGAPAVGEFIDFTQKNKLHGQSGHPEMDPNYVYPVEVCGAVVDASGYATCSVPAPFASILTLLTTPAWANHELFPSEETAYMPIVSVG
jgi:hypothetical protein